MTKNVIVIAEVHEQKIRNVTLEALAVAREIVEEGSISAILLGDYTDECIETLAHYGAEKVYVSDDEQLKSYNNESYSDFVNSVVKKVTPDILLIGHTAMGRDFAPRVAAKLGVGLITDCTNIEKEEADILFTRPIYAGKAFVKRKFEEDLIFATIRPNNFDIHESDNSLKGSVETVKSNPPEIRAILKEIIQNSADGADLTEAKVVVAGGRGVRSADGFKPLYELAELLGGAVGASRGACDQQYCDYSLQIGQTGKVVTPDVYIACGISGAIQHLAGMSSSKMIIAINNDEEAPIFKIADYGIVGDLFEIIPLLIEELKKTLSEKQPN